MGYLLLWIENLAVSLLFVAWLTACVSRWRRKWVRGLAWILPVGLLFLIYLVPIVGIGFTNFYTPPTPLKVPHLPGFYHLAALLICFVAGAIMLRCKGFRKIDKEEPALVAIGWPRAKLFAALLVAIALQSMTFWNLDLEACQRLAALQAEVSATALSHEPAKVPESENAAPIYERAAEILNSEDTSPKDWDEWLCGLRDDPPKLDVKDAKVAEFFQQKKGVISLLHEAAKKPGCTFEHINKEYWPPDFKEMEFQFQGMRQLSRFLANHAFWKASNGDSHAAMQDLQSMYTMTRHECEEPLLVIQLIGYAIDYSATDTLEKILKLAQPTVEDLEVIKIDGSFSHQKPMQKVIRRESLIGWSFLSQFAGRKMVTMQLDEQKMFPSMDFPFVSLYRVFVLPAEMTALTDIYNEMDQVASQPYYQADWDKVEKSSRENSVYPASMIIPLMVPSVKAAQLAAARADATRNTAVLALAMSRYQLKNGRFPDKLSELVPDFTYAVPKDPFDGKPMKYKRTEKGAVIYSIGPDMVDDGGKPMDDKNKGDVTFELLERKP